MQILLKNLVGICFFLTTTDCWDGFYIIFNYFSFPILLNRTTYDRLQGITIIKTEK